MYDKTPILGSIPAMKMGQVSAESHVVEITAMGSDMGYVSL